MKLLPGPVVLINQTDFIEGRMYDVPVKRCRSRPHTSPCDPQEHADYRSGAGDLQWVTGNTRVDHAVDTSKLQKRQTAPTYGDYLELARVVKEVKATADFSLRIVPIPNPIIGAWTDSAL